jgi:DNA (cytosine-5)-methyltransferase 1
MLKVVDLFAGPGGLAEGFSAAKDAAGIPVFDIALSVEKEPSAFATLRLRSFVRQFGANPPDAYYQFLAGIVDHKDLVAAYPRQWEAACAETVLSV